MSHEAPSGEVAMSEPDTTDEPTALSHERPRTRLSLAPAITAVLAVVAAGLTIAIIETTEPNPFRDHASDLWFVGGVVAIVLVTVFGTYGPTALRRWAPNVGLVGVSVWLSGFIAAQTAGSPFAYSGLIGDVGRMSALSTRFTVTWQSADPFVPNRPSEYPPLFPWIVGRTAVLFDVPAWKVLAPACALGLTVGLVAGWLLWRRLVGDLAAFVVVVVAVTASGATPRKPFEVIALAIIVPWIWSTFMRLKRDEGGLPWWAAGLVGGLMLSLYQAYLLFLAPAMLFLILWQLTKKPRWPYLKHLILTAVTALVVASWYIVPWFYALATNDNEQVSDEYLTSTLQGNRYYLPWREANFLFLLLLVGAAFIVWNLRRTTWAPVLLAILVSAYAFRIGASLRFDQTGHTLFFQYTNLPINAAVGAGAVLGVREELLRGNHFHRILWTPILAAFAVVAVLGSNVHDFSVDNNAAARAAHGEPLPSLATTKYSSYVTPVPGFPALEARRAIDKRYGAYALPIVLSDTERLYAYYPYYAYVSRDRTASSSLQDWDAKQAQVIDLTTITDPTEFAAASANTPYGPIDAFVLKGQRVLTWNKLTFSPEQFSPLWFEKVRLPENYTMYLRKDARVVHHVYPR